MSQSLAEATAAIRFRGQAKTNTNQKLQSKESDRMNKIDKIKARFHPVDRFHPVKATVLSRLSGHHHLANSFIGSAASPNEH